MTRRPGRPTIVRRVFLAVVFAFVLVLLAIQLWMYVAFRQSLAVDQGLSRLGRALTEALARIDDDAQARAIMASTDTLYKTLRISGNPAGTVLLQLSDRSGRTVYSAPALGSRILDGLPGQVVERTFDGEPYWVYTGESARWSLHAAEPERTLGRVLRNNTHVVLPYLLLALPIVLLLVWLAVRHGLKPLQRLADRIARRSVADLSPVGFDPRYAELTPLVGALERMLGQLRGRLERERAFVHDAAHELRTPMAVIAAEAHALVGAESPADRQRARAHLEQAIARASHLSQQLLALAALDETQGPANAPVDAAQRLRQALAQAAPQAIARGIELTLDAPDDLAARLDLPAFQSIVENLLHNALRYVHDGARIAVTLVREEDALTLAVEDDGPGIAPAERERVFERFYRCADPTVSGSGLGLAIVRQAVERMGGRIRLGTGLQGRGAGFHVWLPLAPL
ncbi:sensor histidine kinase [Variovorax sp. LT1R16]|uniref:sensor histidine kinase n=1 Tax=Variovorax sp. LT1R16 TaxID=3443728 RepID=UPI003F4795C9